MWVGHKVEIKFLLDSHLPNKIFFSTIKSTERWYSTFTLVPWWLLSTCDIWLVFIWSILANMWSIISCNLHSNKNSLFVIVRNQNKDPINYIWVGGITRSHTSYQVLTRFLPTRLTKFLQDSYQRKTVDSTTGGCFVVPVRVWHKDCKDFFSMLI